MSDYVLRSYQREGVDWLLSRTVAGLAFDAGLGKTLTALEAARATGLPASVVCPAALRQYWRSEAARAGVDARVYSYDEFRRIPRTRGRVLIVDEAHYIKNPTATRTAVVRAAAREAARTWLLTATPATKSPLDYYVPLSMISQLPPIGRWIRQYCRVLATPYGDRVVGFLPGGADRLRRELLRFWMFRDWRDCMRDVPPITFSMLPVENKEAQEILRKLEKEVPELGGSFEELETNSVNLSRIRHMMGLVKSRVVGAALRAHLGGDWTGEKVVVYAEYHDSLNILHAFCAEAAPLVVQYTGAMSEPKREAALEAWRKAPAGAVLLVQIRAGGVGLNLPEARLAMIAEGTWAPADWWQAASRLRRVSDPHPVLVECPYIEDTVDGALVRTIVRRAEMIGLEGLK
jgi:SNF2 family DNA or RNA helicase